jgi:hypothetical protein
VISAKFTSRVSISRDETEHEMGVTGNPILAPTGTDSIAQGAALGTNRTIEVEPQRGVITRSACGDFAPLGLKRWLAPETQGSTLGYRMTPPSGLKTGKPVTPE